MNRYGRGSIYGGPSKATPSTLCQKCLKKDSYECKAVAQERPYVSRPSRTQQLLNPKLLPKLMDDIPQELLRKKGIADEQLAKAEEERGKKRRASYEFDIHGAPKRLRSTSVSSVSTISTRSSRSRSPTARQNLEPSPHDPIFICSQRKAETVRSRSMSMSRSPPSRRNLTSSERKRRRDSSSSADSYASDNNRYQRERSTRRRYHRHSPPARGRTTESRNPPSRSRRRLSNDRQNVKFDFRENSAPHEGKFLPRQRSLSPFSKRLALTQAMNMTR